MDILPVDPAMRTLPNAIIWKVDDRAHLVS